LHAAIADVWNCEDRKVAQEPGDVVDENVSGAE